MTVKKRVEKRAEISDRGLIYGIDPAIACGEGNLQKT